MKELDDKQLNNISDHVLNTLKFYGINLVKMDVEKSTPVIYINIHKKKMKKSLDETLNIAYWVLWSLIYGKYSEKKSKTNKIQLQYDEI